jgi:sec-independent protein translocase protein TatA
MLGNLGGQELLLLFIVILLFFGAKRLPQLSRSLGASMNSFKKGLKEGSVEDDPQKALTENDKETTPKQIAENTQEPKEEIHS